MSLSYFAFGLAALALGVIAVVVLVGLIRSRKAAVHAHALGIVQVRMVRAHIIHAIEILDGPDYTLRAVHLRAILQGALDESEVLR